MAAQIESTVDRLVILWFSKIDRGRSLWIQVQVTLVNAQLKQASLEILHAMPKLRSCEIRTVGTDPQRKEFKLDFKPGSLSYECDDIVCSEFTRRIHIAPEENK
jgi:hypothetical protein